MKVVKTPQGEPAMPSVEYVLRLYVAGSGLRSMHAVVNLRAICERYLKGSYQLEVIDLYQQPERAKSEQIIAIPTLVKELPLPVCRIIGDLSDADRVCDSLGIHSGRRPRGILP